MVSRYDEDDVVFTFIAQGDHVNWVKNWFVRHVKFCTAGKLGATWSIKTSD